MCGPIFEQWVSVSISQKVFAISTRARPAASSWMPGVQQLSRTARSETMSKIPVTAWRGDSTLLCDGMADGLHPFITQHSETVSRVLQACS
jgi:hypothetical protein